MYIYICVIFLASITEYHTGRWGIPGKVRQECGSLPRCRPAALPPLEGEAEVLASLVGPDHCSAREEEAGTQTSAGLGASTWGVAPLLSTTGFT